MKVNTHKMEIARYSAGHKAEWNAFVDKSRNGTFLFNRAYMDYHSDRFADHSLLLRHKGRLCALLPANEAGDTLWTHQGLTYGGLVVSSDATTSLVCDMMESIKTYLHQQGFRCMVYKAVPWIYHSLPSEEALYALVNVLGAKLTVRHISSTIDLSQPLGLTESRRSGLRKATSRGLRIKESGKDGIAAFWQVLESNLLEKYDAHPVHSAAEMRLLMERFPEHIRLYTVDDGQSVLGGTVLYLTTNVVHTQYISATGEGKRIGALDLLFDHLLRQDWHGRRFLDFGKSSDGDGHDLNRPLIFQKEGFGGRGVCYDWYEWTE